MIRLLEKYLTNIPMYLLTMGLLTILLCVAVFASLLGATPFTAAAVLASVIVFSGVGLSSSYLLGKVYGAPSHLQSALITALILSLLFTPTLDPKRLLVYAFIALVAQASKYVVAYKGRHIFNPAAFGAVVGGITQLGFASWWVGSPTFIVPVAVTAFLVLYKTRQLLLGGTFLTVSLPLLWITGTPPLTALGSWPLLFLAGFMLSEPLTSPPRKWQRLAVGGVVAVIASLPFSVGAFTTSPAVAIVAGNLLAFLLAFRMRAGLQLTYKGSRDLTPNTRELTFASTAPLHFEPGQYVELTLMHAKPDARGFRRSFSITSVPGTRELTLGVKFYQRSSGFKQTLSSLKKGTAVQATGIYGDFVLPKDISKKIVFIAGGIGITPFISYLRSGALDGRDVTLLYYVRTPADAAYLDEITASGATVHLFAAKDETAQFTRSRRIDSYTLNTFVTDLHNRYAFVSGPPLMVARAKALLLGRAKRTYTDYFSGY